MQPTAKINRRLVQRAIVFVVILCAAAYGFYWLASKRGDPDLLYAPSTTVGDIAAVVSKGDGAQAVLITPDGKITPSPDYKAGAYDQNVTWRADGGRLFFESDRENGEQHLYRWNTEHNILERRTTDKRPKGFLSFAVPGQTTTEEAGSSALMISGGTIVQIDANTGESKQLLPPYDKNAAQGTEEGGQNSMEAYAAYGNSFVKALWTKDKHFILAVLNRDSGDQSIILQDMTNPKSPAIPLATAKHIGMDIGAKSGIIVFSLMGAEVPDWLPDKQKAQFIKDGKIVPPFKHELRIFDLDKFTSSDPQLRQQAMQDIAFTNDDRIAFGDPTISPDESAVAIPVGSYTVSGLVPRELDIAPPIPAAAQSVQHVAVGDFSHLSWSPDSTEIVAIMKNKNGSSDVVKVTAVRGGALTNLTNGNGSYLEATVSPQSKGSSGG